MLLPKKMVNFSISAARMSSRDFVFSPLSKSSKCTGTIFSAI
ncbi:hypothetical protein X975_00881, partial [Stegodyphus mimosarum]